MYKINSNHINSNPFNFFHCTFEDEPTQLRNYSQNGEEIRKSIMYKINSNHINSNPFNV